MNLSLYIVIILFLCSALSIGIVSRLASKMKERLKREAERRDLEEDLDEARREAVHRAHRARREAPRLDTEGRVDGAPGELPIQLVPYQVLEDTLRNTSRERYQGQQIAQMEQVMLAMRDGEESIEDEDEQDSYPKSYNDLVEVLTKHPPRTEGTNCSSLCSHARPATGLGFLMYTCSAFGGVLNESRVSNREQPADMPEGLLSKLGSRLTLRRRDACIEWTKGHRQNGVLALPESTSGDW